MKVLFRFKNAQLAVIILIAVVMGIVTTPQNVCAEKGRENAMKKILVSIPSFENGGLIPPEFTCDGRDISPALSWSQVPAEAVSLALICDDPDAPVGNWVHWILFNIPATAVKIPSEVKPEAKLPDGSAHGMNSFGRLGYGGPCPPGGTHRYFFKLFALDIKMDLEPGVTKKDLERAMQGHVIAQGELMGRYKRVR